MYKSPINIEMMTSRLIETAKKDTEENIYSAVMSYGVDVDKDELLRALRYDREQYEKGYADGKAAAMDGLVRCKDCKHRPKENGRLYGNIWTEFPEEEICPFNCEDPFYNKMPEDDFFCARGERRGDV